MEDFWESANIYWDVILDDSTWSSDQLSMSSSASASWHPGHPHNGDEGNGVNVGNERDAEGSANTSRTSDPPPLDYPRDFFDPITGKSPEDPTLLWQYRKERPKRGVSETVPPDREAMKQEVEEIRTSLRRFIMNSYVESVRVEAKEHGVAITSTNAVPVTERDIIKIINCYENNEANQRKVFAVFHIFHRDRGWLSSRVDEWFKKNNSVLIAPPITEGQKATSRHYKTDRGGFGVVARQAKSQAIGKFMNPMLQKAGWCVATTKKRTTSSKQKQKIYKKVELKQQNGVTEEFYVVTETNDTAAEVTLKVMV